MPPHAAHSAPQTSDASLAPDAATPPSVATEVAAAGSGAKSRQTIQSVARAARMLRTIARTRHGLTASEIATQFSLSVPTAYHLLATLEDEGFLSKGPDKRYQLGAAAVDIANAPGLRPLPPPAHLTALRTLAERTQETAYLTSWFRGDIRIIATVEGSHAVRVAGLQVGATKNIHARASAKLLLAYADTDRRDELLNGHDYHPLTPLTVTNREQLNTHLTQIRRDGIVRDLGEYHEDVCSLSAPIRHDGHVVAALAVLAPASRFARTETELLTELTTAVTQATNETATAVNTPQKLPPLPMVSPGQIS